MDRPKLDAATLRHVRAALAGIHRPNGGTMLPMREGFRSGLNAAEKAVDALEAGGEVIDYEREQMQWYYRCAAAIAMLPPGTTGIRVRRVAEAFTILRAGLRKLVESRRPCTCPVDVAGMLADFDAAARNGA
jgi:hypothetical protein